jgi:hypothetical protein
MLANVPAMIDDEADAFRVGEVLEDINLKYARLSGELTELEAKATPVDEDDTTMLWVTGGEITVLPIPENSVWVFSVNTVEGFNEAERSLRGALAEIIVCRGELELELEAAKEECCGACCAD